MTLATHAVVGAVVGSATGNPLAALAAGFISHFLLDAIPHWDYSLRSIDHDFDDPLKNRIRLNAVFLRDLVKIGFDVGIGFFIVALLFSGTSSVVYVGAILGAGAGVLPDALQFAYFRFPHEPLTSLQSFHVHVAHARTNLNNRPFLGVVFQIAIIIFVSIVALVYVL